MSNTNDCLKTRLEDKALHYLGCYASSEANLRQILKRFGMKKFQPADAENPNEFMPILESEINALIARYRALGYVDDRAFALGRARAMRARGLSAQRIIQTLKAKGVSTKIATEIMADKEFAHASTDAEADTARTYAQRRRLGQYASSTSQAKANWKTRHLASMMRAGFNYATAKSALFDDD